MLRVEHPLLLATESYSQWKEDEDAGSRAWHRTLIGEFALVRLDSGALVSLADIGEGQLRPGDRVRIVNNRAYRA